MKFAVSVAFLRFAEGSEQALQWLLSGEGVPDDHIAEIRAALVDLTRGVDDDNVVRLWYPASPEDFRYMRTPSGWVLALEPEARGR